MVKFFGSKLIGRVAGKGVKTVIDVKNFVVKPKGITTDLSGYTPGAYTGQSTLGSVQLPPPPYHGDPAPDIVVSPPPYTPPPKPEPAPHYHDTGTSSLLSPTVGASVNQNAFNTYTPTRTNKPVNRFAQIAKQLSNTISKIGGAKVVSASTTPRLRENLRTSSANTFNQGRTKFDEAMYQASPEYKRAVVNQDIQSQIASTGESQQEFYQNMVNQGGLSTKQAEKGYEESMNEYVKNLYREQGYDITEGSYDTQGGVYTSPMGEQYSYGSQELTPEEFAVSKPTILSQILPEETEARYSTTGLVPLNRAYWEARTGAGATMNLDDGTYNAVEQPKTNPFIRRVLENVLPGGTGVMQTAPRELVSGFGKAVTSPEFFTIGPPLPGGEGVGGAITVRQIKQAIPEATEWIAREQANIFVKPVDFIASKITKTSTNAFGNVLVDRTGEAGRIMGAVPASFIPETPAGAGLTAVMLGTNIIPKAANVFFAVQGGRGALDKNLPVEQRIASGIIGVASAYGLGKGGYNFFKSYKTTKYFPSDTAITFEEAGKNRYVKSIIPYRKATITTSSFREKYPKLSTRLLGRETPTFSDKKLFFEPGVIKMDNLEYPVVVQSTKFGKQIKVYNIEGKPVETAQPIKRRLTVQEGLSVMENKPSDFTFERGVVDFSNKFNPRQIAELKSLGIKVGKDGGQSFQVSQTRKGLFGELTPSSQYDIFQGNRYVKTEGGGIMGGKWKWTRGGREVAFLSKRPAPTEVPMFKGGGSKSSPEFFDNLYTGERLSQVSVQAAKTSTAFKFNPKINIPKPTSNLPRMVGGQGLEVIPYSGTGLYETQFGLSSVKQPSVISNVKVENEFFSVNKPASKTFVQPITITRAKSNVIEKQFIEPALSFKQSVSLEQKPMVREKIQTKFNQKMLLNEKLLFKQQQKLQQKLKQSTKQQFKFKEPNFFIPKTIPAPIPKTTKSKPEKKKSKDLFGFFTPEVRRRGKWEQVGEPTSFFGALGKGKAVALKTLGASVRVKKSKTGEVVALTPTKLFGKAKNEFGVLVQDPYKRLSSYEERKSIQFERKKSKNRGLFF